MSTLLTYISVSDGKVKRSSLEVLSRCNQLAEENGLQSDALIIDPKANEVAEKVKSYGPQTIYTVQDPIFKNHQNTPLLKALATAMDQINPNVLAFASTESSKDILGALAANQDAAALADVSEFDLTDNSVKAKRPVMAAKIISSVESTSYPTILTVRSGSYDLVEKSVDSEVKEIPFSFDESELKITLKEIIGVTGDKIDLSEAETVIAAGRGA